MGINSVLIFEMPQYCDGVLKTLRLVNHYGDNNFGTAIVIHYGAAIVSFSWAKWQQLGTHSTIRL